MRKIVRNILLIINIFLAVILLLSYISVYISPARNWLFAFFGLAYPIILILNAGFIIFWIIWRKWYLMISLICIIIGWSSVQKYFQLHLSRINNHAPEETITLLTYNVRLFNYYQWHSDTLAWKNMVEFIHSVDPDIVCFQEFVTLTDTDQDLESLKIKLAPLSYSHVFYTNQVANRFDFGMAIFSKYPIANKKNIRFEESLNGSMYSDIIIDRDTLRIYNCHLQSVRLGKDYNNFIESLVFNHREKQFTELREMSVHMKEAYIRRAQQVDILSASIHSSPYPVIVCGDLNDIPLSYAYHHLSRGMKDAFIESGKGTGNTLRGNMPSVRIDYVLYDPLLDAVSYDTYKIDWSDHYPVTATFTFHEKAGSSGRHSRRKE